MSPSHPPPQSKFETEILTATEANRFSHAWVDLARRALEPNIFFEAEFALPAAAHLPGGSRSRILFVWDRTAAAARLVGVLPLLWPRLPLAGFCRAYVHPQAVLGTPLLDSACAATVLDAMLATLAGAAPHCAGLLLPLIPTGGPTFALLQKAAARRGQPISLFEPHARAILRAPFEDPLSPATVKEFRRQRRRLADRGALTYRRRDRPDEIAAAMEAFLALEAQGWKGRKKTALVNRSETGAFARALAQRMGAAGKIAIDSLEIAGQAVATGIVLTTGAQAYFWKIAYDETHARRSPGVLLTQDFTRRQIDDATVAMTDSCARPNHPMIDRLWSARLALADVVVPFAPRAAAGLALRRERIARALRQQLKALVIRLRTRRSS